jgi:hypothetical protein
LRGNSRRWGREKTSFCEQKEAKNFVDPGRSGFNATSLSEEAFAALFQGGVHRTGQMRAGLILSPIRPCDRLLSSGAKSAFKRRGCVMPRQKNLALQ